MLWDGYESLLYDTVILNPEWGTDAVYKLLKLEDNPVKNNLGKFTFKDLKVIWCEPQYQGKHRELLELMKRFKLCYEIPHSKTYVAPQLLNSNPPIYKWNDSNNLRLRYRYDFMPRGILSRFIVEMYNYIDEPKVWRSGVILTLNNTYAEVIETYDSREIQVKLSGSNKRGLLELIVAKLDEIHNSYHRLKVDKLIPCNCDTCKTAPHPYFHRLDNLRKILSKNKQESQCQESADMVNIYSLIDDSIGRESFHRSDRQTDERNDQNYYNHSRNVKITAENVYVSGSGAFSLGDISGTVANAIKQLSASSDPDKPGIKELLIQLCGAIATSEDLDNKRKTKALNQIEVLAKAAKNPTDEEIKESAEDAITMLRGIFSKLPTETTLVTISKELLPAISQFFE